MISSAEIRKIEKVMWDAWGNKEQIENEVVYVFNPCTERAFENIKNEKIYFEAMNVDKINELVFEMQEDNTDDISEWLKIFEKQKNLKIITFFLRSVHIWNAENVNMIWEENQNGKEGFCAEYRKADLVKEALRKSSVLYECRNTNQMNYKGTSEECELFECIKETLLSDFSKKIISAITLVCRISDEEAEECTYREYIENYYADNEKYVYLVDFPSEKYYRVVKQKALHCRPSRILFGEGMEKENIERLQAICKEKGYPFG